MNLKQRNEGGPDAAALGHSGGRTQTRELVAPLLPIPVVLAGDFQAISTYFFPVEMRTSVPLAPAVSDGQRGVASERDIGGSTINTLPSPKVSRR
jgi:hypothetical protein